jgi:hypothetical protein
MLQWRLLPLPTSTTSQYKALGVDQILAVLTQAGGNIFWDH